MFVLFSLAFIAAIGFIIFFLLKLPDDLKKQSLRPLFILLFAIGLWVATLPTLLSPENTQSVTYPAYNVISNSVVNGNTLTQFPAYTVNTVSAFAVRTYNAYFYLWLVFFIFLLFLLLFWWLMLLKQRSAQLMKSGRDVMEELNNRKV